VGSAHIQAQVAILVEQLSAGLAERGWRLSSPEQAGERAGIVVFAGAADPHDLLQHLTAGGVSVALRDGRIRLSPHFANNSDDVAHFFALLDRFDR
jgi:selenocysteine lyase/cysteine desulfurase